MCISCITCESFYVVQAMGVKVDKPFIKRTCRNRYSKKLIATHLYGILLTSLELEHSKYLASTRFVALRRGSLNRFDWNN